MHGSVADLKFFILSSGSGSTFVPYFGSGSSSSNTVYCHLKLYYNSSTISNVSQWRVFFIISSKLKI